MSWTKEELGKLREHQTSMLTVSEIAEKMQKDKREVRQELVRMGYLPREVRPEPEKSEFLNGKGKITVPKRKYTKITPEVEKRICELREQCFSTYQIADKLNVGSAKTVLNILKRNGYPTERGNFHKEDKPMKAAQINEDFEQAVSEMIAEAKEKEPAPSANDTSSKEITPAISTINDTTDKPECQAISGITALGILESALLNAFGDRADVTRIFAERQIAELFFVYGGQEYGFTFGVKEGVPDYGNDKH